MCFSPFTCEFANGDEKVLSALKLHTGLVRFTDIIGVSEMRILIDFALGDFLPFSSHLFLSNSEHMQILPRFRAVFPECRHIWCSRQST